MIPPVESIYRWQGQIETAAEVRAIFKTSAVAWPVFERTLAQQHPYAVPEIRALEPAAISHAYQAWLLGEVVA